MARSSAALRALSRDVTEAFFEVRWNALVGKLPGLVGCASGLTAIQCTSY